ncbi:MAG: aminotransferase class I/II-fold pyridoxal phosphate-dependent enzyme [Candidatus Eisenbacteria bacterium]|uniref:Aminotransferase class I/II-fold pyridoxal phosphate-dependent enzyme n=1 Tax=Eiseniibacteriota bacterium TaxID=2212470 RepID=A0A956NES3_UNCEI|nr:aminotransferase class I/II-fold pyridoxal phosphate-dependent enzyme [Candidatus Eisenbacteria bacterium]MCB9462378.1 aminotransferase class I/II-fold pyridoxal phosphate-dependent enzyme [Candidatus Eisenbacteria bacterium]
MRSFDPVQAMAQTRHEFGEHGGVNPSVELSTTFTVMHAETMPGIFQGRKGPAEGCFLYGRHFNPTVHVLGRLLAAMEGTEAAYCTASGLSAVAGAAIQLMKTGDHAVVANAIYGGSFALFHDFLPDRMGIDVTFVDIDDLDAVRRAVTPKTKMIYCETLSNPTLVVADIPALADIAHGVGAKLVVDNTFAPTVVTPKVHGADVVVHSLTKYVSGASDIIAGAICGDNEFVGSLMDLHHGALMLLGPTMDPRIAHELTLRLPHLGIRMQEHGRRAQVFAERLAALGLPVVYPGLSSHPSYERLLKIANPGYGHGGILGLDMGTTEQAFRFMDLLQGMGFGFVAVSLGYFDSLLSCSASSTSSELEDEDLRSAGISPGLVRISVGYTGDMEERWNQLESALRTIGKTGARAS